MEARMDFRKATPQGAKAMSELHAHVHRCGLEPALLELIKLRASQINGCAHCIDMHTKELRAGRRERTAALSAQCLGRVAVLQRARTRRARLDRGRDAHHRRPRAR